MTTIGTMGHSRGGEGVVWHVIVDRERADPYGIDAVMPLAPVDFTRETVNRVPLAVVLPYCDGDVFDLQGVHFFDDARYRVAGDTKPKHTLTLYGANHNFFNTVWTQGVPGRVRRHLRPMRGQAHAAGTAPDGRRLHRVVLPAVPGRGDRSRPDLDRRGARPTGIDPTRALMAYLAPDLPIVASTSTGSPTSARSRGPRPATTSRHPGCRCWRGAPTPSRCRACRAICRSATRICRGSRAGCSGGTAPTVRCGSTSEPGPTCARSTRCSSAPA